MSEGEAKEKKNESALTFRLDRPSTRSSSRWEEEGDAKEKVRREKHFNSPVSSLDVVRDPLDKVSGVLGLNGNHLLFDLLHRDLSSEVGGDGEVSTVSRVGGGHHW